MREALIAVEIKIIRFVLIHKINRYVKQSSSGIERNHTLGGLTSNYYKKLKSEEYSEKEKSNFYCYFIGWKKSEKTKRGEKN